MSTILGLKRENMDFKGRNGEQVKSTGYRIFVGEERKDVDGWETQDGIYLTDAKLDGYVPTLGDEVIIFYNRWQKASGIRVIDPAQSK